MGKKGQHVTPHPSGGWQVKKGGSERATRKVDTQLEATEIARQIAKNQKTEVVIHRPNGQIRDKDSYGNDPNPPKDNNH
jgi:uncharacterized protein YdaT